MASESPPVNPPPPDSSDGFQSSIEKRFFSIRCSVPWPPIDRGLNPNDGELDAPGRRQVVKKWLSTLESPIAKALMAMDIVSSGRRWAVHPLSTSFSISFFNISSSDISSITAVFDSVAIADRPPFRLLPPPSPAGDMKSVERKFNGNGNGNGGRVFRAGVFFVSAQSLRHDDLLKQIPSLWICRQRTYHRVNGRGVWCNRFRIPSTSFKTFRQLVNEANGTVALPLLAEGSKSPCYRCRSTMHQFSVCPLKGKKENEVCSVCYIYHLKGDACLPSDKCGHCQSPGHRTKDCPTVIEYFSEQPDVVAVARPPTSPPARSYADVAAGTPPSSPRSSRASQLGHGRVIKSSSAIFDDSAAIAIRRDLQTVISKVDLLDTTHRQHIDNAIQQLRKEISQLIIVINRLKASTTTTITPMSTLRSPTPLNDDVGNLEEIAELLSATATSPPVAVAAATPIDTTATTTTITTSVNDGITSEPSVDVSSAPSVDASDLNNATELEPVMDLNRTNVPLISPATTTTSSSTSTSSSNANHTGDASPVISNASSGPVTNTMSSTVHAAATRVSSPPVAARTRKASALLQVDTSDSKRTRATSEPTKASSPSVLVAARRHTSSRPPTPGISSSTGTEPASDEEEIDIDSSQPPPTSSSKSSSTSSNQSSSTGIRSGTTGTRSVVVAKKTALKPSLQARRNSSINGA